MSEDPNIKVQIESMAYGGKGVARHLGKVLFVQDAIVGDVVDVKITEDNGRFANAEIVQTITPSLLRGTSSCRYSDQCGGCQWHGIDYKNQLDWKLDFVSSAIKRIGKIENIQCNISPSTSTLEYRNRILLKSRIQPDGRITSGYFKQQSRDFVAISECIIADPRINLFLKELSLKKFPKSMSSEVKFRFEVQALVLSDGEESNLLITVYDTDSKEIQSEEIVKFLKKFPQIKWAGTLKETQDAPFFPFEKDLDLLFHTAPGMFQQVNLSHNQLLRRKVIEKVARINPRVILDLYCGSGNLSLPLANGKRQLVGIEYSKQAIACASFNVKVNNLKNIEYIDGDSEKHLRNFVKSKKYFDLIILDPPRAGLMKGIEQITKLRPKDIIYVSCDPTTLARDLNKLAAFGYKVTDVTALDFFPMTYHVETMVHLSL